MMTDVNLGDVVEVLDPIQSNRVPVEKLGKLRLFAIGPKERYLQRFSTPLFASMAF